MIRIINWIARVFLVILAIGALIVGADTEVWGVIVLFTIMHVVVSTVIRPIPWDVKKQWENGHCGSDMEF